MSQFRPCKTPGCRNLVDTTGARKYCCNACRQRAYRERHAIRHATTRTFVEKLCRNCGKTFLTYLPAKQFHSVSCRVSFHQQQKRLMLKAGVIVNG